MFVVRFFDSNNGVCVGDGSVGHPEIYTTTNGGTSWTPVPSSNIPELNNSEGFIPANSWVVDNTIWAPTNGGSLYKSTNRGLTWDATRSVVNNGGSYCAFKDTLNGLLSGSLAQVVKRTTDGGATWDFTETKPQGMSTLFMSYIPGTDESYMICATPPHGPLPGSVYTLDNGATWVAVDSVNHQRAAFVSPSVGWSWGGPNVIYKWTGIPLPVENTNEVVQDFHLEQNYPNPFNPSTSIQYRVSSISNVSLKVYDVLGNEVATLVNEEKPAGSYEVKFDAAGLSSGIYFYSLIAGNFAATKKMLLLK
jgi:Secretion system C-terminal sorting domain